MTIKTRSEKRSEDQLSELLKSENFDTKCIFYSPNENNTLKELFKDCSKSGDKYGIPDRIYFDNKTLIIFECKATNLNKAILDVEHYIKNLKDCDYTIYGVAFVNNTNYKIINLENKTICLETFKLVKNNILINQDTMNYKIHEIHNYIRNYTKISNEDKPFFIACILIALKNKQFINVIENFTNNKKNIYTLIKEVLLEYSLDVSIFDFLKSNDDFYNIIKMVLDIYTQDPTTDLLNLFYHEFVKYSNTDSRSLGIVLTPDHIVKLMVEILNINEDDIVLDLCAGTGSFLLEALKYKPRKIIGCEFQPKLFTLLKCNTILRGVKNPDLRKNDCFEETFKATKSIINPPYGTKGKKELDFVLKQLESIVEGGLAISIIPYNKLGNKILRDQILKISKVKKIIYCNQDLFKPNAAVETIILLLEKNKKGHNFNKDTVNIIDYKDDGVENIIRKGRCINSTFERKYNEALNNKEVKLINKNEEWWHENIKINKFVNITNFKLRQTKKIYEEKIKELERELEKEENLFLKFKDTQPFKIGDIFNIIANGKSTFSDILPNGKYPIISTSGKNDGVIGLTNNYNYSAGKITVANAGTTCSAFYQTTPFCATNHVSILTYKLNGVLNKYTGLYFCLLFENFKSKYNYSKQWSLTRMKNDTIILPISKEKYIDLDLIETEIKNLLKMNY